MASAVLDLKEQLLLRLSTGERVAVPVLLQETPDCRLQQMPEGLGSQVRQHSTCWLYIVSLHST